MPTVEEVIGKYVELRERVAEISKRHMQELEPLNNAMQTIEGWLQAKLNEVGADSFKTEKGTAYKTHFNSVKLADAGAFKGHIFAPALTNVKNYLLTVCNVKLQDVDLEAINTLLLSTPSWDMVDFRPGKKGIMEHLENYAVLPPGVTLDTISKIGVRRA